MYISVFKISPIGFTSFGFKGNDCLKILKPPTNNICESGSVHFWVSWTTFTSLKTSNQFSTILVITLHLVSNVHFGMFFSLSCKKDFCWLLRFWKSNSQHNWIAYVDSEIKEILRQVGNYSYVAIFLLLHTTYVYSINLCIRNSIVLRNWLLCVHNIYVYMEGTSSKSIGIIGNEQYVKTK